MIYLDVNGRVLTNVQLNEIGWDGVDWISLAQKREKRLAHVNMAFNIRVP